MAVLVGAHPVVRGVSLKFADPTFEIELDALWLRDQDESRHGRDPVTGQRLVDTLALPDDLEVRATEIQDGGAWIEVTWAEHLHTTRHSAETLFRAFHPDSWARPEATLWEAADQLGELPRVSFESALTDEGLAGVFESMWRVGACLVDGAPPTTEATERLVRAVGYPRQTVFGGMWTFGATGEFDDSAYSRAALPLHTDGTYTLDPPGWQVLHCIHYDGTGGDSLLADGLAQVGAVEREAHEHYETLCEVQVLAQYIGDGVHLRATHPVVTVGLDGAPIRVMYNNADRAPFRRSREESARFYDAYRALGRRFANPTNVHRFALRPGSILLVDNWRVLHGRTAFMGERVLTGAYLNREDIESCWRKLSRWL